MSARARIRDFDPSLDEVLYFIYLRVSSDDQEEDGMSLPVQDEETLRYGAARPSWVYGGTFRDVETGANPLRADYQRLKAAVRAARASGRRVAIVVVLQSRLGRDVGELSDVWKEMVERLGVEIHATRDGGHIRDMGTFLIRAVMAQIELKNISEGVANSFRRARALGWMKPGRPSWGYRWEPATPEQRALGSPTVVAVPHEHEHEYVRELFRLRAAGVSLYELSAWANALPESARGYFGTGEKRAPRRLGPAAIRHVLGSEIYIARSPLADDEPYVDPLDRPVGRWEPLCDDETWRATRPAGDARENGVPLALRSEYVLTHFLFCECGARMAGHTRLAKIRHRRGKTVREPSYRSYICSSRMSGPDLARPGAARCNRKIGAKNIEARIFGTLRPLVAALATPAVAEGARRIAREHHERSPRAANEQRLRRARDDRKVLSDARADLTISLATRQIDRAQYDEATGRVSEKIDALDAEIARLDALVGRDERLRAGPSPIDVIVDQASYWLDVIDGADVDGRREILKLLVERSTPCRTGYGEYVAGLVWTPLGRTLVQVAAQMMLDDGLVETVQTVWANCSVSTSPDDADDSETAALAVAV